MGGLGEEVGGLDFGQVVAALDQEFEVAGQGGRFAADVDNALGLEEQQAVEGGAIASLARWIQHHDIGASGQPAQAIFHLVNLEADIGQLIQFSIDPSLGDGLRLPFQSDNLACVLG